MATGRKTVVVGQVIDPVAWGNPLWDQSVQTFASAADRLAQFPAPLKGAVTWLDDVGRLEVWNGTAWVRVPLNAPWSAWTPNWVATGGGNALGSGGYLRGRYTEVGTTVTFVLEMFLNTGFNPGVGSWAWTLPVAAAAGAAGVQVVVGQILPSANKWVAMTAQILAGDAYIRSPFDAAGVQIAPGYPLVAGSQVILTGSYEAGVAASVALPADDGVDA